MTDAGPSEDQVIAWNIHNDHADAEPPSSAANDADWVTVHVTYREAALLAFAASWLAISETINREEAFAIAVKLQDAIAAAPDVGG